jgi:hypothetical protein
LHSKNQLPRLPINAFIVISPGVVVVVWFFLTDIYTTPTKVFKKLFWVVGRVVAIQIQFITLKWRDHASKKLQFGTQKCKKIHIGKTQEKHKCQPLFVENWEEKEVEIGHKTQVEDILDGEEVMEEKENEKYLGDVISNYG